MGGAPGRTGKVRDRRAGTELALGSLTCAACLSSIAWLNLGQRLGALDKSPGSLGAAGVGASGGPQARFVCSPLPPGGCRRGGELSPADTPSGIKVHVTALWAVFLSPSSQRQPLALFRDKPPGNFPWVRGEERKGGLSSLEPLESSGRGLEAPSSIVWVACEGGGDGGRRTQPGLPQPGLRALSEGAEDWSGPVIRPQFSVLYRDS